MQGIKILEETAEKIVLELSKTTDFGPSSTGRSRIVASSKENGGSPWKNLTDELSLSVTLIRRGKVARALNRLEEAVK